MIVKFFAVSLAWAGQATLDGPSAPVAPDVITRDESGRATIRAIRLAEPLRVDGRLDDAIYARTPSSELFVFFNEQRDTLSPRFPDLMNRAVIVKANRLLRF